MEKGDHASVIYGTHFPNRLFVGCLPPKATADHLGEFFSSYGKVIEAKVVLDDQRRSKRFGFISFSKAIEAERVLNQGTIYLMGKKINVGPAVKKEGKDILPSQVPVRIVNTTNVAMSTQAEFTSKPRYKYTFPSSNDCSSSNALPLPLVSTKQRSDTPPSAALSPPPRRLYSPTRSEHSRSNEWLPTRSSSPRMIMSEQYSSHSPVMQSHSPVMQHSPRSYSPRSYSPRSYSPSMTLPDQSISQQQMLLLPSNSFSRSPVSFSQPPVSLSPEQAYSPPTTMPEQLYSQSIPSVIYPSSNQMAVPSCCNDGVTQNVVYMSIPSQQSFLPQPNQIYFIPSY